MGALDWEQQLQLKAKQGRPHIFLDMRIVDDAGKELPQDGKTSGNLEVGFRKNCAHIGSQAPDQTMPDCLVKVQQAFSSTLLAAGEGTHCCSALLQGAKRFFAACAVCYCSMALTGFARWRVDI
jgi:hypothetical protein